MQRVSAACGQSNWMVWMPPTISSMWLNRSRLVWLWAMIKTSMVFPFGWSRVGAGRASDGQSQRQGGRRAPWGGGQRAATASDGGDRRRQAEHADRLLQLGGLILHRRCRRCRLLDQGGVLLGHLVHLADGGVDLLDAAALLQAGRDYLAHDVADAGDAVDDGLHAGAGLGDQAAAQRDLFARAADQHLDILGGGGRALRQVAHLGGDDGEAAPLLTGARRLDGRVQRQDIGLEGDAVDDADDVADLLRRGA